MTELLPYSATPCSQRHLHFEASVGLTEVLALEGTAPARADQPGRIVATPFRSLRETTLLLRYDTEDAVAPLGEDPTCELRHMPATGNVVGKVRLSARHDHGWTFVRDVAEALESVETLPLSARYGFYAVTGGVAVDVVVPDPADSAMYRRIRRALEENGIPVRELSLVGHSALIRNPIPLRCDLREGAIAGVADRRGSDQQPSLRETVEAAR